MKPRHKQVVLFLCFWILSVRTLRARVTFDDTSPVLSLCDILNQPSVYAHKTTTITVHLIPTKEGTLLRYPTCPKLWVKLHIDREATPENGLAELREALYRPHPIVSATLTGIYDPDYIDEIRHSRHPVFRVIGAKDIKRLAKTRNLGESVN